MTSQETINEVTTILLQNYIWSPGATVHGAISGLAEDMSNNRINPADLGCSHEELLVAIGRVLTDLNASVKYLVTHGLASQSSFANQNSGRRK